MNQPWVHMCPPRPELHSHLPLYPIPLGCPRAPGMSALLHASNLHWSAISHMVIYMFQCYSLKSSHLCLLLNTLATWCEELKNTLMLGKIKGRRRSGWRDDMVGWHHRPNGLEFKQTPGDSKGQGSLVCCSPWGHKESDMTEWLSNTTNAWVEGEDSGGWEGMVSFSFIWWTLRCEKKRKKRSRWSSKQNQKRVPVFSSEKLEC